MPIYEYLCNSCGTEKEHLQKINDAPIAACPACGNSNYTKRISAAGFQLKGSGWYVTDFKNNKTQKTESKEEAKPDKQESATVSQTLPTKTDNTASTAAID